MNDSIKKYRTTKHLATRRGSIYLAVLGVAMIVSIIGMVSMQIARLQLRATGNLQDLEEARLLAHSGVEFGMGNMVYVSDWRTDCTNNVELLPAIAVGNGTMTFKLVDEDGDLADDSSDPVQLIGIGRVGDAVYAASVRLESTGGGLSCLEASLHSQGNLMLVNWDTITTDQTVSSNGDIEDSGAGITGNAWAVGSINGSVSGTKEEHQSPPRDMPNATSVFDYYIANGTVIPANNIPGLVLEKKLISPNSNPFGGETNPLGIYVIDCQGDKIKIQDCRIVGTLVLLNVGPESLIDRDIHWEAAVANYPALMVQGDLEMKWHADQLLREGDHGVNFNPVGTPYQNVEDGDISDTYPGVIKGLIYVSGNLKIPYECNLEGAVVVGGTTEVDASLTLTYDSLFLSNPPPGFTTGTDMQIVPGTWHRTTY